MDYNGTDAFVSVIIPNYNYARYLDQRIQSVLNQTYRNFEVIILDDCSTDNSLEVIAKYKGNPCIREVVVNGQNSGSPFKQWDKGINLAKGNIIWIAESDDYCEINLLEELVKAYVASPNVVVAYSYYSGCNDDCTWGKRKERTVQYYNGTDFIRNRIARANWMAISNMSGAIFSKEAYSKISKDYLTYKSAGDYRFWAEICRYGKVAHIRKNLTYWRLHSSSVSRINEINGVLPVEDKKVYDYVCKQYGLSRWQRMMVLMVKKNQYSSTKYGNEDIRDEILRLWNFPNLPLIKYLNQLLHVVDSVERHCGLLI